MLQIPEAVFGHLRHFLVGGKRRAYGETTGISCVGNRRDKR